jgi:hypothetical protein
MCQVICEKYHICERQYYRYEKYAFKKLASIDNKRIESKKILAENHYNYEIMELQTALNNKTIDMPTYQAKKLILENRKQLDKIQGLEITNIKGKIETITTIKIEDLRKAYQDEQK